MDSPYRQS